MNIINKDDAPVLEWNIFLYELKSFWVSHKDIVGSLAKPEDSFEETASELFEILIFDYALSKETNELLTYKLAEA